MESLYTANSTGIFVQCCYQYCSTISTGILVQGYHKSWNPQRSEDSGFGEKDEGTHTRIVSVFDHIGWLQPGWGASERDGLVHQGCNLLDLESRARVRVKVGVRVGSPLGLFQDRTGPPDGSCRECKSDNLQLALTSQVTVSLDAPHGLRLVQMLRDDRNHEYWLGILQRSWLGMG